MEKLTKAQKKALQKSEWQKEAEAQAKKDQLKKLGLWGGLAILVAVVIVGLAFLVNGNPTSTTTSSQTVPLSTKLDFEKGPKDSKVTLIEYGDFECPACAASEPMVKELISQEPNLHYIYRFFPLVNVHKYAQLSAQAGYAASLQNKFFEMSSTMFENQNDWAQSTDPTSIFVSYAQKLGMNTDKFLSDTNSPAAKKFVDDSLNAAVSAGLDSTPSFFLNGKRINPTSYDDLKKTVDDAFSQK